MWTALDDAYPLFTERAGRQSGSHEGRSTEASPVRTLHLQRQIMHNQPSSPGVRRRLADSHEVYSAEAMPCLMAYAVRAAWIPRLLGDFLLVE